MLKHRIIPTLLYDGIQCVKPVGFQRPYRKLGAMDQYIQVCERRNLDELILIDIEATPQQREPNYDTLRRYCNNLYCPVTYGGGISSLDHISKLLENGADKVCINSAFRSNWNLINDAAKKFGSQAIVVSIDAKDSVLYTNNGRINIKYSPRTWIKTVQEEGAGEILLTDMQKDGTMEGYELNLINMVTNWVSIPVIASGGCGEPADMAQALDAGASAVAAGSMFLYTENTPRSCAKYLAENGYKVRV